MAKHDDMPPETYKEPRLSLLTSIPAFLLFGLMPAIAGFV